MSGFGRFKSFPNLAVVADQRFLMAPCAPAAASTLNAGSKGSALILVGRRSRRDLLATTILSHSAIA
jgi:hypothetical protein